MTYKAIIDKVSQRHADPPYFSQAMVEEAMLLARLQAFQEALEHHKTYSPQQFRMWLSNSINLIKLGG